jgi:ribosome-binding factor A
MSGSTHDRPARVAHEFQRELGDVLSRGLKDPRITGFITVTGAKMAPDLKDITVYVSIHGDEKTREETLEGLRAAAGYLQREVARRVKLRYTPHLRFAYDGSVAEGDKIERLLKEVKEKEGWK